MNIQAERLRTFCQRTLEKVDVPTEHAAIIATILVETDLRGVTSHGTSLLPRYVRRFQTGLTNPRPRVQVVGERGATAMLDGDTGLGHIVSHVAMEKTMALARAHAVGLVTVRNTTHFGMAGYYAMMAAREGMIGYATSNAGADMAPWQGREPALGNNPIAYAIPAGDYPDIVLDMACSVAAAGRIRVAQLKGEQIPRGWVVGDHTDPAAAMKAPLMPFGAHKGSGLAVVGEILSAVLPGAMLGIEVARTRPVGEERRDPRGIGHFFMAIDVEAFQPLPRFRRRVDDLIRAVKSTPPAPGYEEVLVPGEPEFRARERNLRDGIPLAPALIDLLKRLGDEVGVPFPT